MKFVDHIHTQYIGESGWSGQTWDWLMGTIGWSTSATLVDIINSIWKVAANAVTIVKQAATNVMNAVKEGFAYIQNQVFDVVLNTLGSTLITVVEVFAKMVSELIPEITFQSITNGIKLTTQNLDEFEVYYQVVDRKVVLFLNDQKIEIDILGNQFFEELETLSIGFDQAVIDSNTNIGGLVGLIISMAVSMLTSKSADPITKMINIISKIIGAAGFTTYLLGNVKIIKNALFLDNSPSFDTEDRLAYIKSISVYLLGEKGAIGTPAAIVNLVKLASSTRSFISSARLDGIKQTFTKIFAEGIKKPILGLSGQLLNVAGIIAMPLLYKYAMDYYSENGDSSMTFKLTSLLLSTSGLFVLSKTNKVDLNKVNFYVLIYSIINALTLVLVNSGRTTI